VANQSQFAIARKKTDHLHLAQLQLYETPSILHQLPSIGNALQIPMIDIACPKDTTRPFDEEKDLNVGVMGYTTPHFHYPTFTKL
jgi:hypothetical protein